MQPKPRLTLRDLLLLPLGLLLNMTPAWAATLVLLVASICGTLYYSLNSDFLGLLAPPFADLTFSPDYTSVKDTHGHSWKIIYENRPPSNYTGVVRNVTHWREEPIPFATHDVLVTTGDYSSSALVRERVFEHAVYYQWDMPGEPRGSLHLLHIVPLNADIYHQLLKIREWNLVSIIGREIFRIDIYDTSGQYNASFQDEGCSSILVTALEVKAAGTPVP